MKRLLALLALCTMAVAVQAEKTKYICTISGPDSTYSEVFDTLEECKESGYCEVCEETGEKTVVTTAGLE